MGRTNIKFRQPEVEELTREQRAIYDVLPMGVMQNEFLRLLPPIAVLGAKSQKLIEQLTERAETLKDLSATMMVLFRRLEFAREQLKVGTDPDALDTRDLLAAPEVAGAQIRFTARAARREEPNGHQSNGHEAHATEDAEPIATETPKRRRTRKSAPESPPEGEPSE